jgi:hypothetical protein
MELEVLREKLHAYVETADERHVAAIYVLVRDKIPSADKEYTAEEAMTLLRQMKNKS